MLGLEVRKELILKEKKNATPTDRYCEEERREGPGQSQIRFMLRMGNTS